VTGHTYIVYGALANGATTVMYEGIPTYPDASRLWHVVDKHQIDILYMAPTAIRALMREGDGPVKKTSRHSLRLLGTVGEPINPEAWEWYYHVVGEARCPIVDTWWQTETGGMLITPFPGATKLKPGSATLPFFGVKPAIVDQSGKILEGPCSGNLVLLDSWPGQMRTVYGDHQRFVDTYFKQFPGMYFTGDGARRPALRRTWVRRRARAAISVNGGGMAAGSGRGRRMSSRSRSAMTDLLLLRRQRGLQAAAGGHQRRRCGARGAAHDVGHLGLGEIEDVAQRHRRALTIG
jgi:acetyl-CoA synthetase